MGYCYTTGMRYLILLLISFSVFAEDLHIQTGKDYPAWAKAMDVAYDQAYGDHRPKYDDTEKRMAIENKFWKLRDDNLKNWARAMSQKKYPLGKEILVNGVRYLDSNDVGDYNDGVTQVKYHYGDKPPAVPMHDRFVMDQFFERYAKINNDQTALLFVFAQYRQLRGLKPMPIQKTGE